MDQELKSPGAANAGINCITESRGIHTTGRDMALSTCTSSAVATPLHVPSTTEAVRPYRDVQNRRTSSSGIHRNNMFEAGLLYSLTKYGVGMDTSRLERLVRALVLVAGA